MNNTTPAYAIKLWYLAKSKDNYKMDECWYLLKDYTFEELNKIKAIWKLLEQDSTNGVIH